jgi:hypothetical protein
MVRTVIAHDLHALVEGLPRGWCPPLDAAGPVHLHTVGDLTLVESPLAGGPAWTPRAARRHDDIVATLLDADAVVPFPAGTVVPAGQLSPWLATRLPLLHRAVRRVRGHVEVALRLVPLGPEGDERVEARLRRLADRLVERLAVPAWRYGRDPRHAGGAELAVLVPRGDVAAVLARIAPLVARAADVAIVPSGPRPPYAFVPRLDAAGAAAAVDRAG